jgi:hypothetical protein
VTRDQRVYSVNQYNFLRHTFSKRISYVFLFDEHIMLAPARHVDWDAVGHELENGTIQALTADNDFTSSENEQSQCFDACRILRMERTLAIPYSLIGRVLTIDKNIVRRHFRRGLTDFDGPVANRRPSL